MPDVRVVTESEPPAAPVDAASDGHLPALVAAAQRRDQAALAALYTRYAPMVHGILLARGPVSDADDLVQEVFVTVMEKLPDLRDPHAFGGWVATIARHAALASRRRPAHASLVGDTPVASAGATDTGSRGAATRVLSIIRDLPPTYAETLTLRLVEGLTGPQIAACTGMTAGSVRVNLHRGMKLLRERLVGSEPPREERR